MKGSPVLFVESGFFTFWSFIAIKNTDCFFGLNGLLLEQWQMNASILFLSFYHGKYKGNDRFR
jgi:hypothetical protein